MVCLYHTEHRPYHLVENLQDRRLLVGYLLLVVFRRLSKVNRPIKTCRRLIHA
nr:MAG TPA: hypothetical protein [Caudoviricetes sp.]